MNEVRTREARFPDDDTRPGREIINEELAADGWRVIEETLPAGPNIEEDALGRDASQRAQRLITQKFQLRRIAVWNDASRAVERGGSSGQPRLGRG